MKFRIIFFTGKLTLLILFFQLTLSTSAQKSKNANDEVSARQIEYIKNAYSSKIEVPKEFINGKEYESYYTRSKIKPLLLPDKKRSASIFTKTRKYSNLTLQYDTFLDEVIYTDTSRTINFRFPQIALNKDIVNGFNLYFENDSMVFKYFRLPECERENLREGFYEVAYSGKSIYVIKHTSSFYTREGLPEYDYTAENYINAGNGYYKVTSKGSLLKLFGDKSTAMKKFIHQARIRIKQADKNQLASILKYYDSL
jgi:hypothetical protein